jgi:hypothetical protein
MLSFNFFEDGQTDNIYFSDESAFLMATISEGRPDYLVQKYCELVQEKAELEKWIKEVRSTFITAELEIN